MAIDVYSNVDDMPSFFENVIWFKPELVYISSHGIEITVRSSSSKELRKDFSLFSSIPYHSTYLSLFSTLLHFSYILYVISPCGIIYIGLRSVSAQKPHLFLHYLKEYYYL